MTMDDIFQILIYVIIAISFISSFFKKKKPVQPPTDNLQRGKPIQMGEQVIEAPPSLKQKAEDYNIMKEFESFFNLGDQISPPQKNIAEPVHDDKNIYEGADKRDNYIKVPEESFHKQTSSEHTFINPWEIKQKEIEKKKKAITQDIEKQASLYKENLEKTNTAAKGIVHNIRNRIKDPASLKEYIVISEIIGKPKAYKG